MKHQSGHVCGTGKEWVMIKCCWHTDLMPAPPSRSLGVCATDVLAVTMLYILVQTTPICSFAFGSSPVFNRNNSRIQLRDLQWRGLEICLWGSAAHEADPYFYSLQANYQNWMLWKKHTLGKKCSIAPQPQGNHYLIYARMCIRQTHSRLLVSIIKLFFHHYGVKLGGERD